jgi:hypothetical protein
MTMNIRLIIPNVYSPAGLAGPEVETNVGRYLARIADIAGGFTSWQGMGGWTAADGSYITELVTIVDVDDSSGNTIGQWRLLATDICRDLNQNSVYLRIDGHVES